MLDEDEIARADEAARNAAEELRKAGPIDDDTLRVLLTEARTHYGWQDRPVTRETLRALWDIARMGPTSMNQQPMRIVFVETDAGREKLKGAVLEGNIPKLMSAPVTAILCHDMQFHEKLPELFPPNPNARDMFAGNDDMRTANAFRNGTLQVAWFIIAARAVGLDTGPMSGFNNAKVDALFLEGTTWKSNVLCNLGYADISKIFRRLPRLDFDDVATFA
ncbi:MAG: malonic semialdehyde reductase [Pseudomonadota bacterium]